MNKSLITIFIVDDDIAVRESLSMMIEQEGFAVKTFESGQNFLEYYQQEHLGCAIIDVRMPDMDGLQLQQEMTSRNILLPIIFLTGHGDIPTSVNAVKSGALDFVTKPITREKLLAIVLAAVQQSDKNLTKEASTQEAKSLIARLTERECEVMLLAISGFSNKEIARKLSISHRTVEIHKSKIMHKTKAENLLDLASIAREADFPS